ncbi:MAG: acetylxylan esterase [Kiritimatiellae bacterium]|nr:acetylxylan esterase [Kiritimatiellia bacterium]
MTIRTTVAAAGMLFAANLFGATATDATWIRGVTDKDPITYKSGEEMTFTLTVEKLSGELKSGEFSLDWKRTGDDGVVETGKVANAGAPFVYKTKIAFPGFVRLEAKLVDAKGKQAGKKAFFDGGAGADVDSLEGHPEPKDFDEFWGRQFARLDKIKINPELVEVKSPTNIVKCYAVSVPCAGLRPVTGYLSVPVAVDKGVTFPVKVMFHGYSGDEFGHKRQKTVPTDCILLDMNAHGLRLPELGGTEADRKALRWEARSNGHTYAFDPEQNKDPETAYFNGMVLRVKRALQYMKTQKGWNGRDVQVTGGSQGGLQAIWAAACGEGVTYAEIGVPWNCDIFTNGGVRSDPAKKLASHGWYIKWTDALGYYDAVNFGRRIPVGCYADICRAGLGDYVCPPMGIAKLWNALSCRRRIVWIQGAEHGYSPPDTTGLKSVREVQCEVRALTPSVPQAPWAVSWWMKRHHEKLAALKANPPEVVFLGDSITHFWDSTGRPAFNANFAKAPYRAISLGFSGDRTEHVLWRILHGELDGYQAKAVVLMIGTNNTGHLPFDQEPPSDTVLGIRKIISLIREKQPQAKIILHAIFPRGADRNDPCRLRNDVVNRAIRPSADGKDVLWCDLADEFLDQDGNLPKDIFPDFLHPNAKGYEKWAAAVKPYLDWALSDRSAPPPPAKTSRSMEEADKLAAGTSRADTPEVKPNGRDWWLDRLTSKRREIVNSDGEFDLVMLGDSITHNFENQGKASLAKLRERYAVLDIGYGGDRTENALWRARYGELSGYRAKVVSLLIGCNNTWHRMDKPEDTAAGVKAILDAIAAAQPEAKVLLLPIFPFGPGPDDAKRVNNEKVNALIRPLADGERVIWVDFNSKWMDEKGDVIGYMPDRCHPNAKGYAEVWVPSIMPYLEKFVQGK